MGYKAQSIELRKIAVETIKKNKVYLNTLAHDAAVKYTDQPGGVKFAYFDAFSVGYATALGQILDGSLDIEAVRRQVGI